MTIQFADPGFDFTMMWWGVGITAAVILAALICLAISRGDEWTGWFYAGQVLYYVSFFVAAFGCGLLGGFGGAQQYDARVEVLKERALEDIGFEHANVDDYNNFTASLDGEYFQGELWRIEPRDGVYTYKIMEKVELKTD
jgi:hypothetical protein